MLKCRYRVPFIMPEDPPQLEFPMVDPSPKRRTSAEPKEYLLNPVRVRRYALAVAERERHHSFTAVSVEFIQRLDAKLRNLIRDEIRRHPSMGKRVR
jgi:hypothetical protein